MHIDVVEPVRLISSSARRRAKAAARESEQTSLETVFEIAKLLTGAVDPVAAMPSVFSILGSFMGLRHGALSLLCDPEAGQSPHPGHNPFALAATVRGVAPDLPSARGNDRVTEMVFLTGVPLVSLDIENEFGVDALPDQTTDGRLALIAVPIRAETHLPLVIGVLKVFRPFTDDPAREVSNDLRVMTMIASLLEQALRFRRAVARDRERMFREAGEAIKAAHDAREDVEPLLPDQGIVGESAAIGAVAKRIRKVAKTSTQVLLRGESGTGKELFARAIHSLSDRADKPFIKVNCAALSESLLETELFGHEKGSFTGATGLKKGRFELANGGTLFLDEIGEIKHEFQTKLLRVLQEGEFERVGGTKTLKVDVRLITATNRDLEEAVARGKFRADLYFRICVVPIHLPPLRDRPEDIPQLARTFLDRFNEENGTALEFEQDALGTLLGCRFPGNVRELENCIHRSAALCDSDVIRAEDLACNQDACLSAQLWRLQNNAFSPIGGLAAGEVIQPIVRSISAPVRPIPERPAPPPVPRKTANTEREELIDAMEQAGWVQAKAARLLGMTPRQIGYALRKHDIEIKKI
ncbi:nif-specific transcriptional activator NifA [Tropicimonas isoalkanivorans]|uniref:Nif-specific regulatory protein n=1 Tax=Tropicimonas isoalkanivorans TaxID=441112 RepID=A0A1I1H4R5_9RHOB|nr:nif-specific transcriptional activator NifA [Tropicimonas isoalkanivorans]SFC18801.1 Nif-specific regulatory protein [Tropicimonas isoalkanivorans]